MSSSQSVDSSLSSRDQFDSLRTSADLQATNSGEVEVSLARTTRGTPATLKDESPLKNTPSMATLTKKWQFLLAKDREDGAESSYYQTPPPSTAKLERVRSFGSRQSMGSRHSMGSLRSNGTTTPILPPTSIVKPSLSAQKILHRLHTPEGSSNAKAPPRIPSSSRSWDVEQQVRYRSSVKQNLEVRLRQLESQTGSGAGKKQPPPKQQHTPPRWELPSRARDQSPLRKSFGEELIARGRISQQHHLRQYSEPHLSPQVGPSPTSTTAALSDTTTALIAADACSYNNLHKDAEERDGEASIDPKEPSSSEDELVSPAFDKQRGSPAPEKQRDPPASKGTPASEENRRSPASERHLTKSSGNAEDDTTSFWHRWKLAEKRMQQQQDQFEKEKVEWVRQLESAYTSNAQVEALAKRMEVQLLAVHKTCLHQDDDSGVDEGELRADQEVPIDPLHLLMVKDSGEIPLSQIEAFEGDPSSHDSDEDGLMDSELQERKMARTNTKNIILSHLVKLLERQAEQQKGELEQQLKIEREERLEVMKELEALEKRLGEHGQNTTSGATPKAKNSSESKSPLPTDKDQTKALQNRLWLREQQYEQERKEYDAKLRCLEEENQRYKEESEKAKQQQPTTGSNESVSILNKKLESLNHELEKDLSDKKSLISQNESLQAECKRLQQTVDNHERDQKRKDLKQLRELTRVETQLSRAQEVTKSLEEKAKSLELKLERAESKHGRERKELEWKLLQQGERAASTASGKTTTKGESEWTKKKIGKEKSVLEDQLKETQLQLNRCQEELSDCKNSAAQALSEQEGLRAQLIASQSEISDCREELAEKQELLNRAREHFKTVTTESSQDLAQAREEIQGLKQQLLSVESEAEDCLQELEDCSKAKSQALEQLDEQRERLEQLELERAGQIQAIESMRQLQNKHESDMQEWMLRLDAAKADCESKQKRISDLQTWLEESNVEIAKLQARVGVDKETQQGDDDQVFTRQLEEELTNLEFSLQVERENLEDAHAENTKLRSQVRQLEADLLKNRVANEVAGSSEGFSLPAFDDAVDKALMAEGYEDLEVQLQETTNDLEHCLASLDAERSKCRTLEENNAALETEIENISQKRSDEKKAWEARAKTLVDSVDVGRVSAVEEAPIQLEVQLRETTAQLNEATESLRTEMDKNNEAEERNSKLQNDLQQLNERFVSEMKELQDRYEALPTDDKNTNSDLLEKISHLESVLLESGNRETELRDKNATLELQIQRLQDDFEVEEFKSGELEEKKFTLESELRQLNERFIGEMREMEQRYQSLLHEHNNEHNQNQEQHGDLVVKIDNLESMLSESSNTEAELRERNTELELKVKKLQDNLEVEEFKYGQLEESSSILDSKLRQLNDEFIGEMKELDLHYQSLLEENDNQHQELHAELERRGEKLLSELNSQSDLLQEERMQQKQSAEVIESLKGELRDARAASKESAPQQPGIEMGQLDREYPKVFVPVASDLHNQPPELQSEEVSTVISSPYSMGPSSQFERDHVGDSGMPLHTSTLDEQLQALRRKSECEQKLGEEVKLLEAKLNRLQNELSGSNDNLKRAREKNVVYEKEMEALHDAYAREREEWQMHLHQAESSDSVRTQELLQEKEERERQLAAAKEVVENGLRALTAESEKYRQVVAKNFSLDDEIRQLRIENSSLTQKLQNAMGETITAQRALSSSKEELQHQIQEWKHRHDDLLLEKHSIHCKVAVTEQQIQTLQECHEAHKLEWRESAQLAADHSAESVTAMVADLKQEVVKMGEQLLVSNKTIQELQASRTMEHDLLVALERVQSTLRAAATSIAENAGSMVRHGNNVTKSLDNIESVSMSLSELKEAMLTQNESLRQDIQSISQTSRTADSAGLHQNEEDLALAQAKLEQLTKELEAETSTRQAAEAQVALLITKVTRLENDTVKPPVLEIHCDENSFKASNGDGAEGDYRDVDLDAKLAELTVKIDDEMEQIREICGVPDSEDEAEAAERNKLADAQQAMFAQTMLLVQCIRDLLVNKDAEQEENKTSAVIQHLEILSEVMGHVDSMEDGAPIAERDSVGFTTPVPRTPPHSQCQFQEEGIETDLLQFELAQDDSLCDLRNDVSLDQKQRSSEIGGNSSFYNPAFAPDTTINESLREEASSPIQLVVEQTYNRCQALERERCDLINVTLDLLSASREANKAEIDAALASARRKASEEMIAMKQQTQSQVDQIWIRLCEKCRESLVA